MIVLENIFAPAFGCVFALIFLFRQSSDDNPAKDSSVNVDQLDVANASAIMS